MYYIYKMCHTSTGRVYIGQHKLPKGKAPETDGYMGSGKVWRSIYKAHPEECVKVILEVVETREEVNELERKYIAHYRSVYGSLCVNLADGGEGFRGKHSDATRKKMSLSHRGKQHTEAYKRKMSESMKGENNPNFGKFGKDSKRYGVKHTPEAIEKMRAAKVGNKNCLGHHPSEETREKIRQSLINFNKTHEVSQETREKMSKSRTGRKHSEEAKQKIALSHRGKKHSEETKRKMSEAHKARRKRKEKKS